MQLLGAHLWTVLNCITEGKKKVYSPQPRFFYTYIDVDKTVMFRYILVLISYSTARSTRKTRQCTRLLSFKEWPKQNTKCWKSLRTEFVACFAAIPSVALDRQRAASLARGLRSQTPALHWRWAARPQRIFGLRSAASCSGTRRLRLCLMAIHPTSAGVNGILDLLFFFGAQTCSSFLKVCGHKVCSKK